MAVIDPGPDEEDHIRALSVALGSAKEARILLTHHHRDHAGAAVRLALDLGATISGPLSCKPGGSSTGHRHSEAVPDTLAIPFQVLADGDRVSTDNGELVVYDVPGHTKDHLAFHWITTNCLFVGDLLLGKGETTWIGEYLGSVGDYLASLSRVEALGPEVIFPGHGPPITSPGRVLSRYRRHRMERLDQVRAARLENPQADSRTLAAIIYGGEIPEKVLTAAEASVDAALFHLDQSTE